MRPIGYQHLQEKFNASVVPWWVSSYAAPTSRRTETSFDGHRREIFPKSRDPGDDDLAHLKFALKHEGLNLPLLRQVLPQIDPAKIHQFIESQPFSRFGRILWLLYEHFTGQQLLLPDLDSAAYVLLADPKFQFTGVSRPSPRHKVDVNLLGTLEFSPLIRRTDFLKSALVGELRDQAESISRNYPDNLYQRALSYLYTKESKSSFAIEREKPDQRRSRVFLEQLRQASHTGSEYFSESTLTDLQTDIVDPRFADSGYRDRIDDQVYIGQTIAFGQELVHYVAPKPEELRELCQGWEQFARDLSAWASTDGDAADPISAAAAIAWSFNFLHPFRDGNGRIHRFLIHHVFARCGFTPPGVVLPVSAVMLRRPLDYDRSLESFSKPLLELIEWDLDQDGKMSVTGSTIDHYRYIDCTPAAETLVSFVRSAIEEDLPAELSFLASYDRARQAMREIVDLPNRPADLFIRLCHQNDFKLSRNKRHSVEAFAALSDAEIHDLQEAVRSAYTSSSILPPGTIPA